MAIINVPGTLHSFETGNVLANADEILDTNLNQKQDVINASIIGGYIYKTINGNSIVGEGNIYTSTDSYVTCPTGGSVAEKVVVVDNYQLANGGNIRIKFTNANTATSGVTLKIKSSEDDTSAVAKSLYYSGSAATNTNTWSSGETVAVYYDGANYMANNVAGSELKTAATTNNPDTKKGLTESALVGIIGDVRKDGGVYVSLQDQIYAITASSATVGIGLRTGQGYSTAIIRQIITSDTTTDVIPIYGTCTARANSLTLYDRTNNTGSWTQTTVAEGKSNPVTNTSDSSDNFYITKEASEVKTYNFYVSGNVFGVNKNSSSLSVYYVRGPWCYNVFERENSTSAIPELDSTEINTLSASEHGLIITPRGQTINLTLTELTEGYFKYLYFMIPTAPAGGTSTIQYLILTSGSYTSTLAMDSSFNQTGGNVPIGYTIYRTVPINTTGLVNLRTY